MKEAVLRRLCCRLLTLDVGMETAQHRATRPGRQALSPPGCVWAELHDAAMGTAWALGDDTLVLTPLCPVAQETWCIRNFLPKS